MTAAELAQAIAQVIEAAEASFGTPAAVKRGRNPRWPYVPVIRHGHRSAQIQGLAYATAPEALEAAERHIIAERRLMARRLATPRYRALRRYHGLEAELPAELVRRDNLGQIVDEPVVDAATLEKSEKSV